MKQKTLLLIEDNLEVRENTAEILELAGYEVLTAENGKIGVAIAQEKIPNLIICDIMMPELDGYGVLHILSRQAKTAGIPFIFLTAKAEKNDFRKGMNLGADDYLTKPFEEFDLLDTIAQRLQKVELLQQNFEKVEGVSEFFSLAKGDKALQELAEQYETRDYRAKYLLFLEDSYPKYLYFLNEGTIKTYRTNEMGKELITNLYHKGDFIGYTALFEGKPYQETAMAIDDCKITQVPKQDFFAILSKNRDIAHRFIKLMANSIEEKEQRLLQLAYDSVQQRLITVLLNCCQQSEDADKDRISLDISREDLANLVGTSKETLIRTLSDFKKEGLIVTKGRYITIVSQKMFRKIKN